MGSDILPINYNSSCSSTSKSLRQKIDPSTFKPLRCETSLFFTQIYIVVLERFHVFKIDFRCCSLKFPFDPWLIYQNQLLLRAVKGTYSTIIYFVLIIFIFSYGPSIIKKIKHNIIFPLILLYSFYPS